LATGNAERLKLYVNGELQSLTFNGAAAIPATLPTYSDTDMHIGALPTLGRRWNGKISKSKVYNVALTQDEIIKLGRIDRRS